MKTSKKSLKRFLFFLLVIFSFAGAFLAVGFGINMKAEPKRELPSCAESTSLYVNLAVIGEQPFGAGTEESKLALERKGLGVAFTLNPKTGSWSFLTTDRNKKTCFVAMGKKWHRIVETHGQGLWKNGDIKKVGYSAPFKKMTEELLKEGKAEVGFGEQDLDLAGTSLSKVITHFFIDRFGLFTAVTSVVYQNKDHSYEISSIDSVGIDWTFDKKYENYPIN